MNTAEKIFDWLESRTFEDLNQDQKKLVLDFMGEASYREMQETLHILDGKSGHGQDSKSRIKSELLTAFDSTSSKPPVILLFLNRKLSLGKAAIWIALFAAAFLWSMISRPEHQVLSSNLAPNPDTVYLTEYVPGMEIKRDTMYIRVSSKPVEPVLENYAVGAESGNIETELHIAGAEDRNMQYNRTRNNSLRHDSLLAKIGFVSM
jgi:hypothetical protein